MDRAQQLKEEVSRVGRLLDAGHRGTPIGGELLVAFGTMAGLLGCLLAATAFRYLPTTWVISPLAGAAGFLMFATLFGRGTDKPRTSVIAALATAGAVELAVRGVAAAMPANYRPGELWIALLLAAGVLLTLGALVGLWRLKRGIHAASPANRALIGAWLGLATAIAVAIALCTVVGTRTNNWFGFMLLPGMFWILWGCGWWASAAATSSRWMHGVAAGAWALSLWYAATFDLFSTSLVGLAVLVIAPGVKLMREARATHEA